jgi:cell division protein FtsI (penicillin-binding protein 3)
MKRGTDVVITGRGRLLLGVFALTAAVLLWRGVYLQLTHKDFLQDHGDARTLRTVAIPAHRGMITDRHGEPLAISTPVSSVWADPRQLARAPEQWPRLASTLEMSLEQLKALIEPRLHRGFIYLKRHVDPTVARQVMSLGIPGVSLRSEYRRYYPMSEMTAQLLGFTNVDDRGQEGIELAFEGRLGGMPGAKRVIKDRLGRIVENVEGIRAAKPGRDLTLSIDKRIQYIAYRGLKAGVQRYKARSGSMVILDAHTGEILAMVNQPSYNPNNRLGLKGEYFRNRAMTDVFEPGSTIKPFTVAAALERGTYAPSTKIDTRPGYLQVGRHTVRDLHNYGILDVSGIIKNSSNVGATKIALSLKPQFLWRLFNRLGFGAFTEAGLPGESPGHLRDYQAWREMDRATLAFGYGLSVTTLQLARAYIVLANEGRALPLTLEKRTALPEGQQIISSKTARQIKAMLEGVIKDGTGALAKIAGYRVAGKTGTVHKINRGGYARHRYVSLFAGIVTASRPNLVAVVMIDEPSGGEYFGGLVAAPVFANVMRDTLRLMNIPPDDAIPAKPQNTYVAATPNVDTALIRP